MGKLSFKEKIFYSLICNEKRVYQHWYRRFLNCGVDLDRIRRVVARIKNWYAWCMKMKTTFFPGIAEDVISAPHAWWFPEDEPPEYGWKKSSINLLFGKTERDPDIGSEPLRSTLCKVYPVTKGG